jgi:hypothetical protein
MNKTAEVIAFVFGPILFATMVVVGFIAIWCHWIELTWADYLGAVGAGACSQWGTGFTGQRGFMSRGSLG